jgi:hypothetical protein
LVAPLGELLARQVQANGGEHRMEALGRVHDDLLDFQYDVVACVVALGRPVATFAQARLASRDGSVMRFEERPDGCDVKVIATADGSRLNALWMASVEVADNPTSAE